MLGLILAAGTGTRMRPLTYTRPKALIPVANRPITAHIIEAFKQAGITDLVLVVNPGKETEKGLGKIEGVKIKYVVQDKPLGTAHAISAAGANLKSDFIVVNGDNLVDSASLKALANEHKGDATLGLMEVEDTSKLSAVEVEGKTVKKIIEKPKKGEVKSNLAGTGVYAFSPKLLKTIQKLEKTKRGEYEIPDAINSLIKQGSKASWIHLHKWDHVTYPWDLLRINESILKNLEGSNEAKAESGAHLRGKVIAGKNTLIKAGAYIEGPVIIGENCTIGPNCFIRAHTAIGDNCKIGQSVEIKNSIIMSNTNVPHLTYVGDSIIGSNCNLGAGVVVTNLRFDDKNVLVNINGKKIDSGLRKFGAVIGDDVKLGSSVVVAPGKTIGSGARIWPGKTVYEDVGKDEQCK